MSSILTSPIPTSDLQARISGRVITPAEADFTSSSAAWNLSFQHRAAVVVVPESAQDVAEAIRYASSQGFDVTVQSTGHGVIRPADNSVLIVMNRMVDVTIDADTWVARIGGGAKWDRVLGPAQQYGLAPLLGSTPDVGAVGYTLGGGMGWLARKYGLNIDHVRAFEIVTADSEIRTVSDDVEPELFWALLGGGAGSLGIITAIEVDLVPVSHLYAGNLFYPVADAHDVAQHYVEWLKSAPDELTSSLVFMNYPPFEEVPEFIRGRSFVMIRGAFAGSDADGERLLAHWRNWRTSEFDMWGPMSFSDVAMISNDPLDPMGGLSTSEWLDEITPEVVEILARRVFPHGGPPTLVFGEIRHAGGAVGHSDRGAYGNRHERHLLQMVGVSEDEVSLAHLEKFASDVRDELAPFVTGNVYLNFLEGEDKVSRAKRGFDHQSWLRLRAVKAAYDPGNLFSHGLPLG